MIARPSYEFPPLATIRYTGHLLFALAGTVLAVIGLVYLALTVPAASIVALLGVAGAVLGSGWLAWRAAIVYDATYSGVTISRAGVVMGSYAWPELRAWCHDWSLDGEDHLVSWIWLRFADGKRWVLPASQGRDFRDLRNHLAIHFDGVRVQSQAPLLARFWP